MNNEFPKKKSVKYPHPLHLKVDDQFQADLNFAKSHGYDHSEIARDTLRARFAELRKKIESEKAG